MIDFQQSHFKLLSINNKKVIFVQVVLLSSMQYFASWAKVSKLSSNCSLDCAIFQTNMRKLFPKFINWARWVNSGKLTNNELWHIWLGGGKGYFRHSSMLFHIKCIAVGQPPISYHFWVCWWTSFFENLRPLGLEVAEICWGCWKQPQAHKKCFHNKNLVF